MNDHHTYKQGDTIRLDINGYTYTATIDHIEATTTQDYTHIRLEPQHYPPQAPTPTSTPPPSDTPPSPSPPPPHPIPSNHNPSAGTYG